MIFTSLTLQNVGSFFGRHELELRPTAKDRPIVLIGALNGSGKTTILEALQLGLYGRRATSLFRIRTGYDDFLRSLVNRNATKQAPVSVEISFDTDEAGRTIHYRLVRSWSFRRKAPVEALDIYVNGVYDASLSRNWDEEVERLIPRNLAHLFFFDGEKIETLADPAQSAEILRSGIFSLLGIELVDRLHQDLSIYRRRLKKSLATTAELEALKEIEARFEHSEARASIVFGKLAALNNDLDGALKRLQATQEAFERHGGAAFESRSNFEKERAEIAGMLEQIDESLRNLCAQSLPLCSAEAALRKVMETAESEQRTREAEHLLSYLTTRDKRLLDWMTTRPSFSKDHFSELREYLGQDRQTFVEAAKGEVLLGMAEETFAALRTFLSTSVGKEREVVRAQVEKRRQLISRLDAIERAMETVPTEAAIAKYLEERASAQARYDQLEKSQHELEEEMRLARNAATRAAAERDGLLSDVRRNEFEMAETQRLSDYSARVQQALDELRNKTLVSHLSVLEEHISTAFRRLLRKDSLIESVKIDPVSFAVTLRSRQGHEIVPQLISAGERQILAIALLWGLGKAAGRKIPIVIDTPLGRLDSVHRKQLVDEYFPEASHQVILLSTDEEIDEDLSADLADSIAHSYVLDFDDFQEFTSVKQGYFWQ